ncbi:MULTISPECIES: VacJ [unclassified Paludibacterium]|uniref:VacJ n=1 Tax=unclassified Paludibacterium TaxID=2618429 RepID=UPI001C040F41|nr:VacJ [Paludibacterium sp. B53371]BEV72421.1 hypothetical protein THUN1379_19030 [Paludibacterium sp. THUN1379]
MYEVNRSVIILRPQQPFLDWLNSLPGGFDTPPTLSALQAGSNALLVPAVDHGDELAEFIAEHYQTMFQAELADWCEDPGLWPSPLSASLFTQWFEIHLHGVVSDMVEEPLEREQFMPFDLDQH